MPSEAVEVHLNEIGQIALTVQDIERARSFYRDVLGMQHLFDAGTMSFYQCGGTRLMIGTSDKPASGTGTILYFRVDDLESTAVSLTAKDVRFVQEPHLVARMKSHDLWLAFMNDGEGNTLGLMSEVARS